MSKHYSREFKKQALKLITTLYTCQKNAEEQRQKAAGKEPLTKDELAMT